RVLWLEWRRVLFRSVSRKRRRAPGKSRAVAGKLCHCAKGIGEGGIKISVKSVACMRRAGEDSRGDVGRSGDSSQRKGIGGSDQAAAGVGTAEIREARARRA